MTSLVGTLSPEKGNEMKLFFYVALGFANPLQYCITEAVVFHQICFVYCFVNFHGNHRFA